MNLAFIRSIVGFLKLAEIIASFLTWVLASSSGYLIDYGLGWVVFTGVVALMVAIIFLALYLFEIYPQIFADLRIEGFVSVTITVMHFISGIVAAVRASQYSYWPGSGEAAAASFFAFLTMILFAIDAFLYFFMPTSGRPGTTAPPPTTTSDPDPNQPNNANVPPEYATANY